MKKRLSAAIGAVLLATAGVMLLVNYAQGANDRAFAGTTMAKVLQVQANIPAGTPVERISASVKLVRLPAVSKVAGALTSLDVVKGKTTNTALVKGEQVLTSRFGSPEATTKASGVPEGMQEVSISVAAPRVAGGKVKVGDRVGILASFPKKNGDPGDTNFVLQRVLVSRVADDVIADAGDGPSATFLVTFAVPTLEAEKIVNASEFGKVWLTLQNDKADTGGSRRVSSGDMI